MSTSKMDDEHLLNTCMQDFRTRFISQGNKDNDAQEIKDLYKESLRDLMDVWAKKYRDGELMIEKVLQFRNEIQVQNKRIQERQEDILQEITKIKENEELSAKLSENIQKLREELNLKREIALANKKANKDKLKELHKSASLFKERLGLEIRKLHGTAHFGDVLRRNLCCIQCNEHSDIRNKDTSECMFPAYTGDDILAEEEAYVWDDCDKLQFVFRCINPKDMNEPYSCIISFNEEGEYQITGCDPPLESVAEFERKVRETKNFSALLANLRKSFAAFCTQVK